MLSAYTLENKRINGSQTSRTESQIELPTRNTTCDKSVERRERGVEHKETGVERQSHLRAICQLEENGPDIF